MTHCTLELDRYMILVVDTDTDIREQNSNISISAFCCEKADQISNCGLFVFILTSCECVYMVCRKSVAKVQHNGELFESKRKKTKQTMCEP